MNKTVPRNVIKANPSADAMTMPATVPFESLSSDLTLWCLVGTGEVAVELRALGDVVSFVLLELDVLLPDTMLSTALLIDDAETRLAEVLVDGPV